jgi:hypothetical protein
VPSFERATQDAFFLGIEAADPRFSPDRTAALLHRLGARAVYEVPDA